MPLTDAQLAIRTRAIGSSEAPAVLGIDRYGKTAYDVWLTKDTASRPGVIEQRDAGHTASVGTMLEGAILDWYGQSTGAQLVRHGPKKRGCLSATPDALRLDPDPSDMLAWDPRIGEVKCVGWPHIQDWDDGVPSYVMAQLFVAAHCFDVSKAVVLLHGKATTIEVIEVDVSEAVRAPVIAQLERWWERYVIGDEAPEQTATQRYEAAKKVERAGEVKVDGGPADDLIAEYTRWKRSAAVAEANAAECLAKLAAAMGPFKLVEAPSGKARWQTTKCTDWKAIATELGATAGHVQRYTTKSDPFLRVYGKRGED